MSHSTDERDDHPADERSGSATSERDDNRADERDESHGGRGRRREPEPTDAASAGPPQIDEGRYLYCLVRTSDGDGEATGAGTDTGADERSLSVAGVEGEPVRVVAADGVGAVVHDCDDVYDSADLAQVRRWLVRHQTVVDEAGEVYGTPIPFQFDTILRGGDEGVRAWLREEATDVTHALDALADHWEYRVEVVEREPVDDAVLVERDDRLRDLQAKIDDADEGTAFLLEKRFEDRLAELRAGRRDSLAADLESRLGTAAREVHELERSPTASLADETSESDGDGETLCRFTLLAAESDEAAIGSILDDVASTDGLEVRFTGPWPPYTFAPDLGDGGTTATDDPAGADP